MMISLRGESPAIVIDLVQRVEKSSAFFAKTNAGRHGGGKRPVYQDGANWLAVGDRPFPHGALANISRSLGAVLGTSMFRNRARVGHAELAASRIRVKNSIIVLYPELGLALKTMKPNSFRAPDALENEYRTLGTAFAGGFRVPEPLAYEADPLPCVWLRYVQGRVVKTEEPDVVLKLAEMLIRWYEHSGIEVVTARDYSPLTQMIGLGPAGLVDMGWPDEAARRIHRSLEIAAASRERLLVSQIHGDTSVRNVLMAGDGNPIIIDWELSRRDIVSHDMVKLAAAHRGVDDLYSAWRNRIGRSDLADHRDEVALAAIFRNIRLDEARRYGIDFLGQTEEEAGRHVQALAQSVLKACERFDR